MTTPRTHHRCPLETTPKRPATRFEVRVGHWNLQVEADSVEGAVEEARRRLREELPRLWDLIESLPRDRFRVRALEPSPEAQYPPYRLRSA